MISAVEKVLHHFSIFSTVFTFTDDGLEQRCEPWRIKPVAVSETQDAVFEQEILPHLWSYRHTASADVECVLIPEVKENRLRIFTNYNQCCYEEASMRRFCECMADCMYRVAGEKVPVS